MYSAVLQLFPFRGIATHFTSGVFSFKPRKITTLNLSFLLRLIENCIFFYVVPDNYAYNKLNQIMHSIEFPLLSIEFSENTESIFY
jgi:hypothetical protein